MEQDRDHNESNLDEPEDAQASDEDEEAIEDEPPPDPTTGGPGLTGLTPPD